MAKVAFFASLAFSFPLISVAQESSVTAKVLRTVVVTSQSGAPNNADFRIYLSGTTPPCPGATDPTWAYINSSDVNYKVVVANALTAYATNKNLTVVSSPSSLAGGTYCQIHTAGVRPD